MESANWVEKKIKTRASEQACCADANGRNGDGMGKISEIQNLSQLFEPYLQGFTLPIGFPSLSGSPRRLFATFFALHLSLLHAKTTPSKQ